MKVKVYLKVGKVANQSLPIVNGSSTPDNKPIVRNGKALPTAMFALELDLPDSRFQQAEQVLAQIKLMEDNINMEYEVIKI